MSEVPSPSSAHFTVTVNLGAQLIHKSDIRRPLEVVSPPVYLMGLFFLPLSPTCLLFFTLFPPSPRLPEDVIKSAGCPWWETVSVVTDLAQNSLVAKLLGTAAQVPRKKGEMNREAEREMDEMQKQKGERNMKWTCG